MKTILQRMIPIALVAFMLAGCVFPAGNTTPSAGTSSSTTASTEPAPSFTDPSVEPSTQPTVPETQPTVPETQPSEPSTTPTETVPQEPAYFPMRTVTETALYPAADDTLPGIGSIPRGETVDTIEIGESWSTVVWKGSIYYVHSNHLRQPGQYLVVIDAGHQQFGNSEREPDGPGSTTMKAKVSQGTRGSFTGLAEYMLNLQVAFKLQQELEARGYQVHMIRTTHDVNISNSQRAAVANEMFADAFIRIHANGSTDPDVNGIMTLCQASDNPYNSHLYDQSRSLAYAVLDEMVAITGAHRQFVWETNTMSGINWCQVPVTLVEMGYMTNEKEDRLMATEEYQQLLALGIANGIDRFLGK